MPHSAKNVVLLLTDQCRRDFLGCYGNAIAQTPQIDALAASGVRFDSAYTQNPFCCPARASILTGTYPRTHHLWHNGIQFKAGVPTLGDLLQESGVRTGSVGKIHVNPRFGSAPPVGFEESDAYWNAHPEMAEWRGPYVGFQDVRMTNGHVAYSVRTGHYAADLKKRFPEGVDLMKRESALRDDGWVQTWRNSIPEEYHYNTWIADETIGLVDAYGDDRFFLHVSFPDPHHPFSACEPYSSMFDDAEMPASIPYSRAELEALPPHYLAHHEGRRSFFEGSPPSFREKIEGAPLAEMKRQAYGMMTHVDRSIGRIVSHLAERGLLDDTMLIFTTDHGELLGDHGFYLKGPFFYQSLLNVPMIIALPRSWGYGARGARAEQSAQTNSDYVAHVDLVPTILSAMGAPVPGYLPGHSLLPLLVGGDSASGEQSADYAPRDAVLTEFRPFGAPNMKVLHHDGWKLVYYGAYPDAGAPIAGELFDLANDPEEHRNLWNDPHHAARQALMSERLLLELNETEAPWPPKGDWL